MRKQVVVVFFDETANTFRFREANSAGTHIHGDQEGAVVGDIYISKAAIAGKRPERIKLTIEY
jgi:hypothetical protein